MDNLREVFIRDVRCFHDAHHASVRPITLLVGENSTGKTTFLGCYSVLHQMFSLLNVDGQLDFNEEPFTMGSFRDMVRSRRGPSGRIDEFQLGFVIDPQPDKNIPSYELFATFREEGSQPIISSFRVEFQSNAFLELKRYPDKTIVLTPDHKVETNAPVGHVIPLIGFLMTRADDGEQLARRFLDLQPVANYFSGLFGIMERTRRGDVKERIHIGYPDLPELIAVAPLRSKPIRTYDPVRETASPEGAHIPMLMMRLNRTNRSSWDSLHDDLVAFGRSAGLFSDIKVKGHGRQMSDPFQLQVKVRSGPHANIMDVGYGVSQSLPIMVDVMTSRESGRGGRKPRRSDGRSFLLQQPEVHLHPKGQAELASLLIEAFKKNGDRFLIETHSDYIVDRVRISVRKLKLKPEDVSILYFEPSGNAVTIHNITLDKHGNLQDAPVGYRDFFVKESDQLLGFAD